MPLDIKQLDEKIGTELSKEDEAFCREVFVKLFEATAGKPSTTKIIYPYSHETAYDRLESSHYCAGRDINRECAAAIDKAISDSRYKPNFYNLQIAAYKVLLEYGFNRVQAVLACQFRAHDPRFSQANKDWADGILYPVKAFEDIFLQSHAILVDGIADCVRELYTSLDAERFALPGNEESGGKVKGYRITRAFMVDDKQGYALQTA